MSFGGRCGRDIRRQGTMRREKKEKVYKATDSATLEQQVMSESIPKSEREHWAKDMINRLRCDNIECHFKRDVLDSLWDAIHQTPACGLNAILCAAAQEIDALRNPPQPDQTEGEV